MSKAKEIAEDRYARGEITEEEYERIIAKLDSRTTHNQTDSEYTHIIECRKCNAEQDALADTCSSCGIENPYDIINDQRTNTARKDKIAGYVWKLLLFVFAIWLIGRVGGIKGIASNFFGTCDVISTEANPEIFVTNGEPDYGYRAISKIRKTKNKGDVIVEITLSTGEGTFTKKERYLVYPSKKRKRLFWISQNQQLIHRKGR